MKSLIRLCRPKHYLKNLLLFVPLLFGSALTGWMQVLVAFWGFSFLCSAIYIINDLHDRKADALHPTKCSRPLASGAVSVQSAVVLLFVLLAVGWILLILACWDHPVTLLAPGLYLVLNLLYSFWLKTWVLVDVAVLASGYLIRLFIGAGIGRIEVSPWLYLVVLSVALFLSLGKRMGELRQSGHESRPVLEKYPEVFLQEGMTLFGCTAIVFYALWACSDAIQAATGDAMLWSVPLVIFLYLRYRYLLERGSAGDPVEVILGDWPLLILGGVYVVYLFLVYGSNLFRFL